MTDPIGALLWSRGAVDAEASGAVHASTLRSLAHCGDTLGLGTLHRVTVLGAHYGCVIAIDDREVLAIYTDPGASLGAIEATLDQAPGR
jgi:predicted regulator of Ras-like GTPase activity (Roadblock/LC7/MglB family)